MRECDVAGKRAAPARHRAHFDREPATVNVDVDRRSTSAASLTEALGGLLDAKRLVVAAIDVSRIDLVIRIAQQLGSAPYPH
jgi:hypothetical protein